MKISVALCTYNGEKFLQRQLQSIEQQTRLPDEVVICDDASSDATLEIAHEFARTSPLKVTVHAHETNLGSNLNFESAIMRCTGDLILLCDQDDLWFPHKAATHEAAAAKADEAVWFSDGEIIDEDDQPLGLGLWEHHCFHPAWNGTRAEPVTVMQILQRNMATGAAMAFRGSLKTHILPIGKPGHLIHDGWIAVMGAVASHTQPLPEKLIGYRRHPEQQVGFKKTEKSEKPTWEVQSARQHQLLLTVLGRFPHPPGPETELCNEPEWEYLREYARHLHWRMQLPPQRVRRLIAVAQGLSSGNYQRYSKGWKTGWKDLIHRRK